MSQALIRFYAFDCEYTGTSTFSFQFRIIFSFKKLLTAPKSQKRHVFTVVDFEGCIFHLYYVFSGHAVRLREAQGANIVKSGSLIIIVMLRAFLRSSLKPTGFHGTLWKELRVSFLGNQSSITTGTPKLKTEGLLYLARKLLPELAWSKKQE